MKKLFIFIMLCLVFFIPATLFAGPTVFPTGTTIYKPEKSWSGYTVLSVCSPIHWDEIKGDENPPVIAGIPLINMNGKVVREWKSTREDAYLFGEPAKIFPGGRLFASYKYKEKPGFYTDLPFQMDWDGNIEWMWDKNEKITLKTADGKTKVLWSGMQHHDMNRWPSPTGYYAPGLDPDVEKGKILINGGTRNNVGLWEITWDGKVIWEWHWADHKEEYVPKKVRLSSNTASWLGPNKWYDAGDERFHPDNIILEEASGKTIYIISKKTGKITWQIGPDYKDIPHLKYLGLDLPGGGGIQVGGMLHHGHMIPKGLPGEGNILVFNNGNPYSMIYEFNPVTLELVWEYSGEVLGYGISHGLAHYFFNPDMGSVQRLPNGNTLICEANSGRIFEVTPELETVWEYIYPVKWLGPMPFAWSNKAKPAWHNAVYRAYRVPYEWVPQLAKPVEKPVIPPDNADFQIVPEAKPSTY